MDTQQRWRVVFAKRSPIKYVAHLDLCQAWERALRRAGLPLAYSQGFNPQARLQIAAALPVGYTACAELMDIILARPIESDSLLGRLRPVLPLGLEALDARVVDLKTKSLQSSLCQAEYHVTLSTALSQPEIERRLTQFMSQTHFEHRRTRKQRAETIDLRPLVENMQVVSVTSGEALLWLRVHAGATGNVRPETVLDALGLTPAPMQIERTRLILDNDALAILSGGPFAL